MACKAQLNLPYDTLMQTKLLALIRTSDVLRVLALSTVSLLIAVGSSSQIKCDTALLKFFFADSAAYRRNKTKSALIWDEKAKQQGNVIKYKNEIYFLPDQFGAVFKASKSGDSIFINRLDKTIFSGYNTHQYCFISEDRIYGYGGYGVWRSNGQLRAYNNDAAEWDIVRLNADIQSLNEYTYYDSKTQKLWCCQQEYINEVLAKDAYINKNEAFVLDLRERKWTKKGEFIKSPANQKVPENIICETDLGLLTLVSGPKFQILDLENNRRYDIPKLSDSLRTHFLSAKSNSLSIFYTNKNITLYDEVDKKGVVKTFKLEAKDLILSKTPVFKRTNALPKIWVWLLAIASLAAMYMFYGRKKMARKAKKYSSLAESMGLDRNNATSFPETLDPLELELVKHIIEDTKKGLGSRTDIVNRILGTERKSIEIQKKQRSDALASINKKFSLFFQTSEILIKTRRTEEDRRLFEYFISNEHSEILEPKDNNG